MPPLFFIRKTLLLRFKNLAPDSLHLSRLHNHHYLQLPPSHPFTITPSQSPASPNLCPESRLLLPSLKHADSSESVQQNIINPNLTESHPDLATIVAQSRPGLVATRLHHLQIHSATIHRSGELTNLPPSSFQPLEKPSSTRTNQIWRHPERYRPRPILFAWTCLTSTGPIPVSTIPDLHQVRASIASRPKPNSDRKRKDGLQKQNCRQLQRPENSNSLGLLIASCILKYWGWCGLV